MKRILASVLLLAAGMLALTSARAASSTPRTPQSAAILCPPGVYTALPEDCLPLGPSQYLGQMAAQGITLPLRPLPAAKPDPTLAWVNFSYAKLNAEKDTPVYASLEDALAGATPIQMIAGGLLKYISYTDTAITDGGDKPDFFKLRAGGWVSADAVSSRIGAVPGYQGLTFKRTPPNAFGWITPFNPTAETKRTPGLAQNDYTGHVLTEYDVVQIYAVQTVGTQDWYLIGPDEWIDGYLVGHVIPRATPPEGVNATRWIEVNLKEQTLAVYEHSQLIFATLIASGVEPYWTRPGVFQIYKKLESTLMSGTFELDRSDFYYLEDVPWTMYYDDARALHGAYWRTRFGFPQSHGCVNLSPGDAHWLYDWAQVGDWVYVWDPSGETPTDPKYFTYGAP